MHLLVDWTWKYSTPKWRQRFYFSDCRQIWIRSTVHERPRRRRSDPSHMFKAWNQPPDVCSTLNMQTFRSWTRKLDGFFPILRFSWENYFIPALKCWVNCVFLAAEEHQHGRKWVLNVPSRGSECVIRTNVRRGLVLGVFSLYLCRFCCFFGRVVERGCMFWVSSVSCLIFEAVSFSVSICVSFSSS